MEEKDRNDDVPMIELYKVESIIVHVSKISRNTLIGFAIFAAAIVAAVYIFVSNYNKRTKDWLNTIQALQNRPAVTEVTDENTGTVQQFPSP